MSSVTEQLSRFIDVVAQGHPAARQVLTRLSELENGAELILKADKMGLRGEALWRAYGDYCAADLSSFATRLADSDYEMVHISNNLVRRSGSLQSSTTPAMESLRERLHSAISEELDQTAPRQQPSRSRA